MNLFAYLHRWARVRRGESPPWWGIERTTSDLEVNWRGDLVQKPLNWNELRDLMLRPPAPRMWVYPPGWTITEYGPLPPGWTVADGRPVRPLARRV